MFLDETAFEVDNGFNSTDFNRSSSNNRTAGSFELGTGRYGNSTSRPSTASNSSASLAVTCLEEDQEGDMTAYGSAGGIGTPSSSRARMLAQQREIQLKRRQSSMQSGGMIRSSLENSSSNVPSPVAKVIDTQLTPALRQFSAPKANLRESAPDSPGETTSSEFSRPNTATNKGRVVQTYKIKASDDEEEVIDKRSAAKSKNKNKNLDDYEHDLNYDEIYKAKKAAERNQNNNKSKGNKKYSDDEDNYNDPPSSSRNPPPSARDRGDPRDRDRPPSNRSRDRDLDERDRDYYDDYDRKGRGRDDREDRRDDRVDGRRDDRDRRTRDNRDNYDDPSESRDSGRGGRTNRDGGRGGRDNRGDRDGGRERPNDYDDYDEYDDADGRGGRGQAPTQGKSRGRGQGRGDNRSGQDERGNRREQESRSKNNTRRDPRDRDRDRSPSDVYEDEEEERPVRYDYDEEEDQDRGRGERWGASNSRSPRDAREKEPPVEARAPKAAPVAKAVKKEAVARTPLNLTDMRSFLLSPLPKSCGICQCYIRRNKSGTNKLFPLYALFLKDGDRFLMASKKRPNNKTSNYLISMGESDLSKDGAGYLGKLRSNFVGTDFQIFDNGINPSKEAGANDGDETSTEIRRELASVVYNANVLGSRGPRKMQVAIPIVGEDGKPLQWKSTVPKPGQIGGDDILSRMKERNFRDLSYLINKPPRWNEQVGAYVLNFNGRVTMASVKNFQLVDPDNQSVVVLQFGRVGKDEFTMDLQWPMSPFQAFAITLSSFDSKIACD